MGGETTKNSSCHHKWSWLVVPRLWAALCRAAPGKRKDRTAASPGADVRALWLSREVAGRYHMES